MCSESQPRRLRPSINGVHPCANALNGVSTFGLLLRLPDTGLGTMPARRFIPAAYAFPEPENPWQEEILVQGLPVSGPAAQDFIGIKPGDVNLDAVLN